jgi:hypothetical protein
MHKLEFLVLFSLGSLFGFFISGLLLSNKISEAWHDGHRAGKYHKNDTL